MLHKVNEMDKLRKLYTGAVIKKRLHKHGAVYEVKIAKARTEKQSDEDMVAIRKIFGSKLRERFTLETGRHFEIYTTS